MGVPAKRWKDEGERWFYVTLLSNFSRAFDKYSRAYSKNFIPESTFPDRFFLLKEHELSIGIEKAARLLEKNGRSDDRLIALETRFPDEALFPNTRTGRGHFIPRNFITVETLHRIGRGGMKTLWNLEEAYAASLKLNSPLLKNYADLQPRSLSILPIALACDAACPFCFSKASVSYEQETRKMDLARTRSVLEAGKARGAERAVITGGGEPGKLPFSRLLDLVKECSRVYPKVILITNGSFLSKKNEAERKESLQKLAEAGLTVLAVSRHHASGEVNEKLMHLPHDVERTVKTWATHRSSLPNLKMRAICVLQKGGVDSLEALENYLTWAAAHQIPEICFKELYVSTSQESVYYSQAANKWSRLHQVSLKLILDFAQTRGWKEIERLPWGARIFEGAWEGAPLRIAAYTEPSLFWERRHGIARSWNLMADGRCLASLEDRNSEIIL